MQNNTVAISFFNLGIDQLSGIDIPIFLGNADVNVGEDHNENCMELKVLNQETTAIQFNPVQLTVDNIAQIPIIIQVDNVLSAKEIAEMAVDDDDWTLQTLTIDKVNFWALSPTATTSLEAGETLTIPFKELRVVDKNICNGTISIQLNYKCAAKLKCVTFQQATQLLDTPIGEPTVPIPSENITPNFKKHTAFDSTITNQVVRTPLTHSKNIVNELILELTNKIKNAQGFDFSEESRALFFLFFVPSNVSNSPKLLGEGGPLATIQEINGIDVSSDEIGQNMPWSIRMNELNEIPYWILQPRSKQFFSGSSEQLSVSINNIITHQKVGDTQLCIAIRDVPGLPDYTTTLSIEIEEDEVHIGHFTADGQTQLSVVEGTSIHLKYEVYSLEEETWEITNNTTKQRIGKPFTSEARTPCAGFYDFSIEKEGKYKIELQSVSYPMKKQNIPIIPITITKKIENNGFTFEGDLHEKTIDNGSDKITLLCSVFCSSEQEWIVEDGAGFSYTFSSDAGVQWEEHVPYYNYALKAKTYELTLRPSNSDDPALTRPIYLTVENAIDVTIQSFVVNGVGGWPFFPNTNCYQSGTSWVCPNLKVKLILYATSSIPIDWEISGSAISSMPSVSLHSSPDEPLGMTIDNVEVTAGPITLSPMNPAPFFHTLNSQRTIVVIPPPPLRHE